jgi:hypothetical protein
VLFTSDATFIQGAWSPEEESQLLYAIEELAKVGITDASARGFWVSVSKAFCGTRTPKQCRNKWYVIGSKTHLMLYRRSSAGLIHSKSKSEMKARRAGIREIAIFWFASTCCIMFPIVVPVRQQVYRIASLNVDEETDIDLKSLQDASWNAWSPHSLQQRWKRLKASINSDSMSHRGEYMTYVLRVYFTLHSQ